MDNSEEGSAENLLQQDDESPAASGAPFDATSNVNADSGSTSIAKPIRRRSRASKKSPNTLKLSANPENFRSIVQKYTGSSSSRKGPITLNFADYNYNDSFSQQSSFLHQQHHQADYGNFSMSINNTTMQHFAAGDLPSPAATTTTTAPVFVPTGEVEDFVPDEEFTIDEDLAIMLQELQSEPPGSYPDFPPAGSSNNNDDFW